MMRTDNRANKLQMNHKKTDHLIIENEYNNNGWRIWQETKKKNDKHRNNSGKLLQNISQ